MMELQAHSHNSAPKLLQATDWITEKCAYITSSGKKFISSPNHQDQTCLLLLEHWDTSLGGK